MKKTMIIIFMAILSMVVMYGNADALVGLCSACHTMHDSQNGAEIVGGSSGAQERLLVSSCIACHTGATGKLSTDSAPIVLHTTAPTDQGASQTLAGGDFYWVADSYGNNDTMGHNVVGVSVADGNMATTNEPPGWDQAVTTGTTFNSLSMQVTQAGGWDASNQLTCAGTYGCHGTHQSADFGGISGSHHDNAGSDDSVSAPTTVAGSYRFLANIKGLENVDWNFGESAASHNEYYGANLATNRNANAAAAFGSRDTISYLCAQCHGTFHGSADSDASAGAPWVRHPTDITLPNTGEYQYYNPDAGGTRTYDLDVPVARPAVPADCTNCAVAVPGTDIVMCLSCHRAHGSPVADLLRFTYNMTLNTGTTDSGCFMCHTAKNADTGAN